VSAVDVIFGGVLVILLIIEGAHACAWAERADGRADS
jgi:hypothetical protein